MDNEDIIDELLDTNEELEDLLEDRTTDLITTLEILVQTQGKLIGLYEGVLCDDEEYEDERSESEYQN